MNRSNMGRRLFLSLVCVFLAGLGLILSLPIQAQAEGETLGDIPVRIKWEGDSPRPQSLILRLYKGRRQQANLSLSSAAAQQDGSWQGCFQSVPIYDREGQPIEYSVQQDPLPGYSSKILQQPGLSFGPGEGEDIRRQCMSGTGEAAVTGAVVLNSSYAPAQAADPKGPPRTGRADPLWPFMAGCAALTALSVTVKKLKAIY